MSAEKFKILIVDDEPAILRTLSTYLRHRGYECATRDNARSALEWLSGNTAHIIIADLSLEGVDGLQLIKRFIKEGDLAQTIAISAQGGVDRIIEAYRSGISDYLPKPFENLDVVGQAVDTAAERLNRWRNVLQKALSEEGRV